MALVATAKAVNNTRATKPVRKTPGPSGELAQVSSTESLATGPKTTKRTLWKVLSPLRQYNSRLEKRKLSNAHLSSTWPSLV
jgi:hypothetical protein